MIIDLDKNYTQAEFAEIIGVTPKSVSDMKSRNVIYPSQSIGDWIKLYCAHLREQAAGRATTNELDLASERAGLAREQRLRIEMQNAVTRREYAPIEAMENGLADVMGRVASQLETIPGKLKKRSDKLTSDDLDLVTGIIADIRNDLAETKIDWFGEHEQDNEA